MNYSELAFSPHLAPCRVLGAGFFAPDYDSAQDAFADVRRGSSRAPEFSLVQGRLRRFTSRLTQMHIDAAGHAVATAGIAPSACIPVFATELGETGTTLELLRSIEDQGVASAARFAQSVHSTSAGLFSIATGNQHPAYALALREHTFYGALLEARMLCEESGEPVLLCVGDDALPPVLRSARPGVALAAAFVLRASSHVAPGVGHELRPWALHQAAPEHLHGTPIWPGLQLLMALSGAPA